uniref:Uncharacterized protein n=1 Tax=Cacopsylla melanoneura TaxID=428564 RepID=A0A8D8VUC1_9HEMI
MLLTSPITSNASNCSPPQHPMPATVLHLNILCQQLFSTSTSYASNCSPPQHPMPATVLHLNILCQQLFSTSTSYASNCSPPQHPNATYCHHGQHPMSTMSSVPQLNILR